jgi:hypothetical protein
MARKPENSFIERINKKLPIKKLRMCAPTRLKHPAGHWLHYEKMSNPYRGGTADSWYSGAKSDLWLEYKYLPRLPQRASVKPFELLSPLQLDWLGGRLDEGRQVGVIIGCPTGGVVLLNRAWEREIPARDFASLVVSAEALAEWILASTVHNEGNTG